VNIVSKESPRIIKIIQGCTQEEKRKLEVLVCEYKDVFAWPYNELKTYDPKVIKNAIPLEKDTKPFKQRQRHMNPKVAPII
jgi:hypothetical protein